MPTMRGMNAWAIPDGSLLRGEPCFVLLLDAMSRGMRFSAI